MMFGFNPAQMKRLMKELAVKDIDAKRVIIETSDGKIIIENPKVTSMELQGQKTYTILGTETIEKAASKSPSEEDIALVQSKTGKSRAEVEHALQKANNDLALAIKILQEQG